LANSDWREVYRQERRRPGYVIDNGRSVGKVAARTRAALHTRAAISVQSKAA